LRISELDHTSKRCEIINSILDFYRAVPSIRVETHALRVSVNTYVNLSTMNSLELIGRALRLERSPFISLLTSPDAVSLSLGVVFLAGISLGLGQSLVLFVNRIRPRRFAFSLLVSAFLYIIGFLFSVFSIWLVAKVLFDKAQHFRLVLSVVGLSYAPYLLGFFILTPYFGSFFSAGLSLWRLAALLIALEVTLFLNLWQALVCSILAWLLLEILERTMGGPIQTITTSARRFAAGRKLEDTQDILRKRYAKLSQTWQRPKGPK
jgi:hypothetical protein